MARIDSLIDQLNGSGQEVFWQGKASAASVDKLEELLSCKLPQSFRAFLLQCGGGGVVEEEISGIEDDDPSLEHRGTVYGDTLLCRSDYGLPSNLVVIYLGMDDVVWCLDVEDFHNGECPVVSFDVFSRRCRTLAKNFEEFLGEYVKLRVGRQADDNGDCRSGV